MPAAAQAVRTPQGSTAYDGKIALAKEAVEKRLRKLGYHPDGILDPTQLLRAAVYKTLELCYRDMASRNDSVSWDKAKYYAESFEEEITTIEFDFDPSVVAATPTIVSGVTSIPLYRA